MNTRSGFDNPDPSQGEQRWDSPLTRLQPQSQLELELGPRRPAKEKFIRQAMTILRKLKKLYPEARCALNFQTPEQLLFATILSAQCTDERVNQVTKILFNLYPSPHELAAAPLENIKTVIRSTGFYNAKAKSLQETASALVKNHQGKVPRKMAELIHLRGVGRKTANVLLGNAFGLASGVVVDTHVGRIARRLGWTRQKDPEAVERDLMDLFAANEWILLSHLLIFHGRQVCKARAPLCQQCPIGPLCPSKLPKVDKL